MQNVSKSVWIMFGSLLLHATLVSVLYFKMNAIETKVVNNENVDSVSTYILISLKKLGYSPDINSVKRVVHTVENGFPLFNLHKLDKIWVYSIFIVENPTFNPNLIGQNGEIGIGQLMPESIVYARKNLRDDTLNPFFIEDNVLMALSILEHKSMYNTSTEKIITAYNGIVIRDNKMCMKYYKKVLNVRMAILKEKNIQKLRLKRKI